jgi:uncharacterized phage infection (PIP) family protein YhgE
MNCPLCEIDYPHSHFSYNIAEYVDALRDELELSRKIADEAIKQNEILTKQLVELQSDKAELISQRDTWIGNADALRRQFGEIIKASKQLVNYRKHISPQNFQLEKIDDYINRIRKSLAEINRIGGMNE